jgi:hypothetical protein
MAKKKILPLRKTVRTTNHQEWLDVNTGISNDKWERETIIRVFGIPIFGHDRELVTTSKILNRDGEPIGFKDK